MTFDDFFPTGFASQGVLNKYPTVWLAGDKPANTCIPLSFPVNTPFQSRGIPGKFVSTNK
jgi:hypothetical protein